MPRKNRSRAKNHQCRSSRQWDDWLYKHGKPFGGEHPTEQEPTMATAMGPDKVWRTFDCPTRVGQPAPRHRRRLQPSEPGECQP
jgi:hypothetical protein